MKMPQAVVNGDYAAVADMNGRDVYVFNKSGKVSNQTLNYDITNIDIASQGVYVVILSGENENYINAYDKDSLRHLHCIAAVPDGISGGINICHTIFGHF